MTTEQLNDLILQAQHTTIHNLVIDFDGEVVIDPEVHFPDVALDRYKFSTKILDASLRNTETADALYAALYVIYDSLEEPTIQMPLDSELQLAA